ncbi:hypothetical protein BLNAU_4017 [Blattamonas nauphoetae]|uniref:Uncharacterized protein n=1 Tax=Blattamonas nauphoetae TaxID=2049346 RepID=A0ABQ9YB30_9EUKA|nr:hypothetical protein BLNAU_4017 [Blattamonas nauphoetae]
MFTHQLIAIAEEEHAITKLLYSGLENADEEDPEKVRQNSDSNNPLHKYSLKETKLAHQNVTGFERKKAQNGNSLRKDAECDPNQPCRIRSSAKRIPETWTEDRVDREEEEGVRRARRRGRRETSEKTRKAWDEREDEEGVRRARRRGRRGTSEKTRKAWDEREDEEGVGRARRRGRRGMIFIFHRF